MKMLQTARQLSAGMGAPEKDKEAKVPEPTEVTVSGNAPLGLWIGERFLGTHINFIERDDLLNAGMRGRTIQSSRSPRQGREAETDKSKVPGNDGRDRCYEWTII